MREFKNIHAKVSHFQKTADKYEDTEDELQKKMRLNGVCDRDRTEGGRSAPHQRPRTTRPVDEAAVVRQPACSCQEPLGDLLCCVLFVHL